MCWICLRTVLQASASGNSSKTTETIHSLLLPWYAPLRHIGPRVKLTGQAEQNQPVHDQDGPENGQIEHLEPAAQEPYRDRLGRVVPELELGEPAHKRSELFLFLCRQPSRIAVLHAFVLLERVVEFGRYEGEEEIQEVDAE